MGRGWFDESALFSGSLCLYLRSVRGGPFGSGMDFLERKFKFKRGWNKLKNKKVNLLLKSGEKEKQPKADKFLVR